MSAAWDADLARRRLPHWVYRCYDADGVLLYIGMTYDPKQRIRSWRSRSNQDRWSWFCDVARMSWCAHPDQWRAGWAEREAIQAERPLHNRDFNPNFRQTPPRKRAAA